MARAERRTPASGSRRQTGTQNRYQMNTYVDGNTVRKLQAVPKQQERVQPAARRKSNAMGMNLHYVVFLTVAAIVTVLVCINYLKLQAQYTTNQKKVTSLGTQLSELKLENDSEYNRIVSSVDLEHIKDVAMNEYGMVYAGESQIRIYDSAESDYVKQYQDVPEE